MLFSYERFPSEHDFNGYMIIPCDEYAIIYTSFQKEAFELFPFSQLLSCDEHFIYLAPLQYSAVLEKSL